MKNIPRPEYLNDLISFKDKDIIKIITGIRRCGKSTLFDLYIDYLKENGVTEDQIFRLNLEETPLRCYGQAVPDIMQ